MTRWPFAKSVGPIGLDLGTHSFHAVQLRRSGDAWQPSAAVTLPRVNSGVALAAVEIERLRDVLERRGFVGREVVLAVPAAGALSTILELPARAPGVPIEAIAAAEFGRVHRIDPAAVSMTTWDLPSPARASRATFAMAVGVKSDTLRAHVDTVESCGLRVTAVDEPLSAVGRAALAGSTPVGQTAVIDFGHAAARLAVVHGRTLAYTRVLSDAGLTYALRAAAEAAHVDPPDLERTLWQGDALATMPASVADAVSVHLAGMVREIGQAFGYAARQYPDFPIAAMRLAGGGASLPGVSARFAEELGVPVTVCGDAAASASQTLARGLAMFEAVS